MSSNEKPPRTLTRSGSVLPSIAWATALSDTGSPWWYVSSVASAAAPQLVSHCWTMTLACRISSRERTGPRPSAEAAPATTNRKKAQLVCQAFSRTALPLNAAPLEHAYRYRRVHRDRRVDRDRRVAHVGQVDGDIGQARGDLIELRFVHLHRLRERRCAGDAEGQCDDSKTFHMRLHKKLDLEINPPSCLGVSD